MAAPLAPRVGPSWERIALVACFLVAVAQGGFIWWNYSSSLGLGTSGTVAVESRPSGLQVLIDGEPRGATPVTLSLPEGPHVLELRGGSQSRVLPIAVTAGTRHAHYLELPSSEMRGALQVRDYSGSRVLVDGQLRGVAPLTIGDLAAGDHEVVIETRAGQVRHVVSVRPGVTATLSARGGVAAAANAPDGTGTVQIEAPYEMQVQQGGRVLGTTSQRFALPAGRHELEIVSETLRFRTTVSVDVAAGATRRVPIALPQGTLSITSVPSAEVWIDGVRVGETPIAAFSLPIGPHEVTFKHPELGERHHAVSITADAPANLDVKLDP